MCSVIYICIIVRDIVSKNYEVAFILQPCSGNKNFAPIFQSNNSDYSSSTSKMVPLPSLEELEVDFKSLVVMSNSVEGTPENELGDKESWSDELTEPNSSATSPRIDPNIVLYSHIAFLYEQRKFYELLASIPNINTNSLLPLEIHLMLACTLFRLGRITGGLREMSLAIELEPIYYKREKYIKTLSQFFNKIGMKEEAVSCFGEIIHMAKAEALKKNDGEHGQQMSLKLRRYQEELEALLRGDDEEEVYEIR